MIDKILRDSLMRGWIVTIIYYKGGQITKRNIEVKAVSEDRVIAYCHLREGIRMFSLKNIFAADYCRKMAN